MSSFITPESKRNTNPRLTYTMNPDALEGFRAEVFNNRQAIAFRYLLAILEILDDERSAKPAAKTGSPKKVASAADEKVDE